MSRRVEENLGKAFLWDEIGNKINHFVLMDEPYSALVSIATAKIAELIIKPEGDAHGNCDDP